MIEDFKLFRSSQPGPRGWEEVQVATGGSQRTSPDGQAARTPSRMPRMSHQGPADPVEEAEAVAAAAAADASSNPTLSAGCVHAGGALVV